MGEINLVDPDIDGGARLVRQLDSSDLRPDAAVWRLTDGEWTLILEIKKLATISPIQAYKMIQEATGRRAEYPPLRQISLIQGYSLFLSALRGAFRIKLKTDLASLRVQQCNLMGVYVEDALIYRL